MSEKQGRQKARLQMSGNVLEHVEKCGSLQGFWASRREKLALMKAMTTQGLIVWNKTIGKYELTAFGHKRLEEYRHEIATGI